MIRLFAWCGTYTSMSSTVFPHSARTSFADDTITRVANLKTSRPFIFTNEFGSSKCREPEPGDQRDAPLSAALHTHRPRPVSEEQERRAILPVEDLRQDVPTHDERAARQPR